MTLRFEMNVDMANAAFAVDDDELAEAADGHERAHLIHDGYAEELARILRKAATHVEMSPSMRARSVLDVNGNTVGGWQIVEEL